MSVPYITFLKHAEYVIKAAPAGRPVLKGVYHHPNKSLIVTDSHRLYVAKDAHSIEDGAILTPKTGERIEGTYPEVSRLIPESDHKGLIHIEDVKQTLEAVKALLTAGSVVASGVGKPPKNSIAIKLNCLDDNRIILKTDNGIMQAEYFLTFANDVEPGFTITFRAEYLAQALALFKDAGYTKVDLKLYGSTRPFILTSYQDSLQALILPIRTVN